MNKVRKALMSAGVALALMFGGTVLTAPAAQAATYSQYYTYSNGVCYVYQWVDYNWWEETFLGYRDHSQFLYYYRCTKPNPVPVY